ncbi:MAG: hypothetical protein ACYCZE_08360 [Thiobacillus sp.]
MLLQAGRGNGIETGFGGGVGCVNTSWQTRQWILSVVFDWTKRGAQHV